MQGVQVNMVPLWFLMLRVRRNSLSVDVGLLNAYLGLQIQRSLAGYIQKPMRCEAGDVQYKYCNSCAGVFGIRRHGRPSTMLSMLDRLR